MNFDIDTICLRDIDLCEINDEERSKFRKLQVKIEDPEGFLGNTVREDMGVMWRLSELELVTSFGTWPLHNGKGNEDYGGDLLYVREGLEEALGGREGWVFPRLRVEQVGQQTWAWPAGPPSRATQI